MLPFSSGFVIPPLYLYGSMLLPGNFFSGRVRSSGCRTRRKSARSGCSWRRTGRIRSSAARRRSCCRTFPPRTACRIGGRWFACFRSCRGKLWSGRLLPRYLHHLARLGRSHLHINAGGALRAEAFLLVPVVKAYPLAAFRAALEMAFSLVLG